MGEIETHSEQIEPEAEKQKNWIEFKCPTIKAQGEILKRKPDQVIARMVVQVLRGSPDLVSNPKKPFEAGILMTNKDIRAAIEDQVDPSSPSNFRIENLSEVTDEIRKLMPPGKRHADFMTESVQTELDEMQKGEQVAGQHLTELRLLEQLERKPNPKRIPHEIEAQKN
ncbi:MAG: hypothetical protein NT135_01150 [Candidatus Berkelbacteria bacterium]|nr:hypothetical protein [Candidatus Berkelbacteria bacterium]